MENKGPKFLVFSEWHHYDGGGMDVNKFNSEQELADWLLKNEEQLAEKDYWIIKGGIRIKPTVKAKVVVDTYKFEEANNYNG